MTRILMLHNTEMSAEDYRAKLFKRYPILAKHTDLWKVDIVKIGRKLTKAQRGRKYDSLYYDEPTVAIKEIVGYLSIVGHPQVIPVDMSRPITTQGKVATQRKKIAYTGPAKIKPILGTKSKLRRPTQRKR